jgi:AcrR family transcriptional regulator
MTKDKEAVKRLPYRSPLRAAQARATRLAIIEAAGRLFVERGYAATSIDAVAEAAGAGRATVFASVGGKAALLKAAYDVAVVGDDEPIPLPERPWAHHVRQGETQGERIKRYAEMVTMIDGRYAPIYEAFRGAASADPEVRQLWQEIRAERRRGGSNFVRLICQLGSLREGLEREAAADIVWILNDPGLYHQLVLEQAWSPADFCTWLAETMHTQLLGPRTGRPRRTQRGS